MLCGQSFSPIGNAIFGFPYSLFAGSLPPLPLVEILRTPSWALPVRTIVRRGRDPDKEREKSQMRLRYRMQRFGLKMSLFGDFQQHFQVSLGDHVLNIHQPFTPIPSSQPLLALKSCHRWLHLAQRPTKYLTIQIKNRDFIMTSSIRTGIRSIKWDALNNPTIAYPENQHQRVEVTPMVMAQVIGVPTIKWFIIRGYLMTSRSKAEKNGRTKVKMDRTVR